MASVQSCSKGSLEGGDGVQWGSELGRDATSGVRVTLLFIRGRVNARTRG